MMSCSRRVLAAARSAGALVLIRMVILAAKNTQVSVGSLHFSMWLEISFMAFLRSPA